MKKEIIFCVDSDGTVMDTMTFKHKLFFCPLAIETYAVDEKDQEKFTENWLNFNLYSITRGINRFEGLISALKSIDYDKIDLSNLAHWVKTTASLSNDSLEKEIEHKNTEDLKWALVWSNKVNEGIKNAQDLDFPFPKAKEALEQMQKVGQVYIVSSANEQAVSDEWKRHGLMDYVEDIYCQDKGSKAFIVQTLKEKHTGAKLILLGDAMGDEKAAFDNDILYYPILVNKEEASWDIFIREALGKLKDNRFDETYQQVLLDAFHTNFK